MASNKVFIAIQFKWPGQEKLREEVLEKIKSACKENGYDADVVSQHHTDYINDRIIAEIRRSRFVVAEFTFNNRGVYFEAGFARGLGLDVFHLIKKDHIENAEDESKKIHFDIKQINLREWETPEDLFEKLKIWIESSVGKFKS